MIKAEIKECIGIAHDNSFINHCMRCLPFWGKIPVCPEHYYKLTKKGYCKDCKKHYEISFEEEGE